MATLQQLEAAFIAADDAGNEEDARAFAQEIVRLRGQSNPAKQYQAGPVPKVTQPSFLNEMVQGPLQELGQGATFGTLDELEGGIAALTGGDYQSTVDARRKQNEQYRRAHPGRAFGMNLLGGMATSGPLATKTALAKIAGYPFLKRMGAYGLLGAGGGALSGAGTAEEGERLGGAATGATVGGLLGAGLPALGNAAMGIGKWGTNKISGLYEAATSSPTKRAMNKLSAVILDPDEAASALCRLGNKGMLADVDTGTQDLTNFVANMPGQGRVAAINALKAREAGTRGEVTDMLLNNIDDLGGFNKALKTAATNAKEKAAPLYDEAYKVPVAVTEELQNLTQRPSIQSAPKSAVRLAEDEGHKIPDSFPSTGQMSSMRVWDYIKRGLDDVIESGKNQFGRLNEQGRAAYENKLALLEILDANPAYKIGRAAYGGEAANETALIAGRKFMSGNADDIAGEITGMSASELTHYRAGMMQKIKDTIEDAPDGSDMFKRIFGSPGKRAKVAQTFPNEKAFKEFSDRMESLSTFRKTSDTVRANSATAVRQAGAADLGISGRETEMFGRALSGANPSGVIGVAGREQMNALLARQMDEPTRAMLLRILTSQNPQEQAATLAAIRVLQVPQPGAAGFTGPMNVPGSRRYGGLFPILMGNQTGLLSQ